MSTEAELRTALDTLPAGGGTIVVRSGTYVLTRSIDVRRDNVMIRGEGGATYFLMDNGGYDPVFVLGEPTPAEPTITHRNITLSNMRIDGNRVGNPNSEFSNEPGRGHLRNNCVTIRRCVDTSLEDVILESARSGGVVTEKSCENLWMSRVTAFDHHFDGIACYNTRHSFIVNCTSRANLDSGFSCDCDFDECLVADCFFIDNTKNGMFISNATNNLITNCTIRDNRDQGVYIRNGVGFCSGPSRENVFAQNYYYCNTNHGIWQDGATSDRNILEGGVFKGNLLPQIRDTHAAAPLLRRYEPFVFDESCP